MNFEQVNNKQLQDIERLTKELMEAMRKAGQSDDPLYRDLAKMLERTEIERRARYDANDSGYKGF